METITKYKAFDDEEFVDAEQCKEHEAQSTKAIEIFFSMPKRPSNCGFDNGGGYIQHDCQPFNIARNQILELAKFYTDHRWIQESIDKGMSVHPSYASRIIGEIRNKALNNAWYRVLCTDNDYREWGQPYFANNPEKAEQIKLN